jgi:hypothetical protein
MTQRSNPELTFDGAVYAGPIRRSLNTARNVKGSIHDDATASKLGLRGGTVAGSIHMDLFPPLCLEAFGQHWYETGCLSLYFVNATTDGEPVRAFLKSPESARRDNVQAEAWIEREDGMRVAEGTASVGAPGAESALHARPLDRFEAGELRILAGMKPGDAIPEVDVRYTPEQQARRLEVITEPLEWYSGTSPWGGPVVTPAGMVNMLYQKPVETLRGAFGKAVGLFGAIEVRHINGPAFVDEPYTVQGRVVAVGQSPKTEHFWFDTQMDDPSGKRIAEMRMLLRFMKASSPRYQQES